MARKRGGGTVVVAGLAVGVITLGAVVVVFTALLGGSLGGCSPVAAGGAGSGGDGGGGGGTGGGGAGGGGGGGGRGMVLGPPGTAAVVGASEYGGPGDPSSGVIGADGANLVADPDTYAELGGESFQTATAMGGLPYMTPLRISWGGHSLIAYKRDIGLGGGPIDGYPRVIDLWWELAGRLGIPYADGLWSGPVRIARPPLAGAGELLDATPALAASPGSGAGTGGGAGAGGGTGAGGGASAGAGECKPVVDAGVPVTPGPRAVLLPDGLAAAPAGAPPAVKEMIAAGNELVGKPYVYGAGHGLPLDEVGPAYDCSSSVEHILFGGGLLPVDYSASSSALESFGAAGLGRWVTIYASADHVFMYIAGLRWDTHNAAGADDGSSGIGWHPLIREAVGFVARHPVGL
jgi:hypothetical protein